MKPIGITLRDDGEIMIVHLCLGCSKISKNRIAGDDITFVILELLDNQDIFKPDIERILQSMNIYLLTGENRYEVECGLYGK